MNYTNAHNLPQVLVDALTPERRPLVRRRYSVSALTDAPLIRILNMIYKGALTKDVSEELNSLLGNALHAYLDAASPNKYSEHRMKMAIEVDGEQFTISGVSDYYEDGTLTDWKVTSVWSYLFGIQEIYGVKPEWFHQLNVYALMHRREGREVREGINYVILRDWMVTKKHEEDYPEIPFIRLDVPIMGSMSIEKYVTERIMLHAEAERIAFDIKNISMIPPCTAKERWEKKGKWKVFHPDIRKSMRNLDTKGEAEEWLKERAETEEKKGKKGRDMTKAKIEYVPGESTRCLNYCSVANVCPYYDQFTKGVNNEAE